MKRRILLIIIATAGLFSCEQGSKSTPDTVGIKTLNSVKDVQNDKGIFTKYEYADSMGKRLIICNVLPKSRIKYTDPNGDVYGYAVFWTRITNETDNPLELKIDFPVDS